MPRSSNTPPYGGEITRRQPETPPAGLRPPQVRPSEFPAPGWPRRIQRRAAYVAPNTHLVAAGLLPQRSFTFRRLPPVRHPTIRLFLNSMLYAAAVSSAPAFPRRPFIGVGSDAPMSIQALAALRAAGAASKWPVIPGCRIPPSYGIASNSPKYLATFRLISTLSASSKE